MRREAFGPFATFNDIELARLLALVGAGISLAKLQVKPARGAQVALTRGEMPALRVSVQRIERFGVQMRKRKRIGIVESVREATRSIWAKNISAWPMEFRLAIDATGASNDPANQVDVRWLNQLLVKGLPVHGGAVVIQASASSSFKWDWPLQTGVIAPDGGPLAALVKDGVRYERLLESVDPEGGAACEVLLVAGSLAAATKHVLSARLEASLLVVLGDSPADWHETQALIQVLRSRLRAGAVACCAVGVADQATWLVTFVEELAHNRAVDQALQTACQATNGPLPLVVGDGRFVALSPIAETAKRIGRAMAEAPPHLQLSAESIPWHFTRPPGIETPTSRELGMALVLNADKMLWRQERGDAAALVSLRTAVARAGGEPYHAARIEAGQLPNARAPRIVRARTTDGAPIFASREVVDVVDVGGGLTVPRSGRLQAPRWVQAHLFGGDGNRRTTHVVAQSTYALEVSISPRKSSALVAPDALDETVLQPSEAGHLLKIAFTPLWRADSEVMHPAQVQHVHLPAGGDSGKASFYFRTPKDARLVRARLVVLAENRVLQTLILEPKGRGAEGEVNLALRLETAVSADLGDRSVAPAFGASIVINDDSAGTMGLTVIAGDQVEFFEPAGLDAMVSHISTDLGTLNTGTGGMGEAIGLDHPELQRLLLGLALKGKSLHQAIVEQSALKAMSQLKKIQFVEAVPKGYFPIELAYEGKMPSLSATLCPNAAQALVNEAVHATCPHAGSTSHHCPAAFWGFSKCIERHTEAAAGQHKFAQPTSTDAALRPFSSVLLGASQNVLAESIDPPAGIRAVVEKHGMKYARAGGWAHWRTEVSARSPSTLLLLPHSESSVETYHVPALEIGGDLKPVGGLDPEDVIGPDSKYPLVLVLGCSTGLTKIAFVNSISEFRKAGAAITLGTVALITGRQTVRFVEKLLEGLKLAAEMKVPFDEAFLQVKRAMLAEGNPFVLSLVAYGDSGWRLEL